MGWDGWKVWGLGLRLSSWLVENIYANIYTAFSLESRLQRDVYPSDMGVL
jgi:hypothetical protein